MKKITFLLILFFSLSAIAQEYSADTLRVNDLTERCTEFKNYNKIQCFVMDNGFAITEGMRVKIGTPATSRMEFQTLMRGNITTAALIGDPNLHRNFVGTEYVIRKVFVVHSGFGKKSALRVGINMGVDGGKGAAASSMDLLASLETGELEILGMLTKEQAIKKMLEVKELYDAGFLTDEEFEAKKAELIKFVK